MTKIRQVWRMLSSAQRRRTGVLLAMMLVGMVLETASTGAVIPALAVMQGDVASTYPALTPVLDWLGNPRRETLILGGMLALVVLYVVKALFLGILAWGQSDLVARVQSALVNRLFAGYLRQPYTFHLQRNSAEMLNHMDNAKGVAAAVQVGLTLIAEVLVLAGIAALLLVVEPVGGLAVVSLLGLAGWLFHRFTRNRMWRWGEQRIEHNRMFYQHLQEGLGGAKEVKLLGREEDFLSQFSRHAIGSAKATQHQTTLQALPRLWLELLAIAGLAGLIAAMVAQGKPIETLLPTAALFAAAAFRSMPSFNRVIGAVQGIRGLGPLIDATDTELSAVADARPPVRGGVVPFRSRLTLEKVTFQYEATDAPALQEISLDIEQGTTVGFVGQSGAGKSTLADVILGLLAPLSGAIRVDGRDIQTDIRGWQDQIGYVPQSIYLTDDTLRRNVAFGLATERIDEAAVRRAIRSAQLEEFVRDLPRGLDTVVGERGVRLSGGQRQRIGIARALYHDPAVLVLDEATSALDMATERGVMDAVRALHGQKTILIIAHRQSTVEHCDRVIQLDRGRLTNEYQALPAGVSGGRAAVPETT